MNWRLRRHHTTSRRGKVGLAAIQGDKTPAVLAPQFDVYPNQTKQWKA